MGFYSTILSHRRLAAMYLAGFLAADLFLVLTVLNWNFGGSGDFATGPVVVVLVMGMLYGPVAAAIVAHGWKPLTTCQTRISTSTPSTIPNGGFPGRGWAPTPGRMRGSRR